MRTIFLCAAAALMALSACSETANGPQSLIAASNLTERGYQLLDQQQPRAALAVFDQAIGGNAKDVRAYQGKGIALNKLGKHDEADTVYEAALKQFPDAVGIKNNLAMSHILRGKYQDAITLLAPLAKSEPENDVVQQNYALANCLLGKREDARKLYSKRLPSREVEENLRFCKAYEGLKKK